MGENWRGQEEGEGGVRIRDFEPYLPYLVDLIGRSDKLGCVIALALDCP